MTTTRPITPIGRGRIELVESLRAARVSELPERKQLSEHDDLLLTVDEQTNTKTGSDSPRRDVLADSETFRDLVRSLSDRPVWRVRPAELDGSPDRVGDLNVVPDSDSPAVRERELVWRLWLLDDGPLGLTLAGAAFRGNPLLYANQAFRELTGYSMERLHGVNPRFLQASDTTAEPVADLREAIANWNRVTVELENYRHDGNTFLGRVRLVLAEGADGTTHRQRRNHA